MAGAFCRNVVLVVNYAVVWTQAHRPLTPLLFEPTAACAEARQLLIKADGLLNRSLHDKTAVSPEDVWDVVGAGLATLVHHPSVTKRETYGSHY